VSARRRLNKTVIIAAASSQHELPAELQPLFAAADGALVEPLPVPASATPASEAGVPASATPASGVPASGAATTAPCSVAIP
jgi:hypothetical protein